MKKIIYIKGNHAGLIQELPDDVANQIIQNGMAAEFFDHVGRGGESEPEAQGNQTVPETPKAEAGPEAPAPRANEKGGVKRMPKVSEVYAGGNFLNVQQCNSLGLWGRELQIADVRVEQIHDKSKIVLDFGNATAGYALALNKTNANIIAERYGDDTAGWIGKTIHLVKTKQQFQGRLVDAIQVVV